MSRTRLAVQVAATTLLLLCLGVTSAAAGPRPVEPSFAPPAGQRVVLHADPSMATEIRLVLTGAAAAALIVASVLLLLLWRRAHASAGRLATS
jgi:hypothetical protein